jgi:hypothetical protein
MYRVAVCTRRSVLRVGAFFSLNSGANRLSAHGRSSAARQTVGSMPRTGSPWRYCEYSVHATIILGSIPFYLKKNVGGAAMSLEQSVDNLSNATALQFIAGSWPDRLHGFNRFGAIQEIVREEDHSVSQSGYTGFIPSSREEGLTEARKAFSSPAKTQMFTVAFGKATKAGCTFLTQHRVLDANLRWTGCADLLAHIEPGVTLPPEEPVANYGPGCLPTFLFAARRASAAGGEARTQYVHNGKVYRLRVQSKFDKSSGNRVITGWTSAVGEKAETEFRFWVSPDDLSGLPLKIEFRPKSFLRLTLEATEGAKEQALKPLL